MAYTGGTIFLFFILIAGIVGLMGVFAWLYIKNKEVKKERSEQVNPLLKSLSATLVLALIVFGILFMQQKQIGVGHIFLLVGCFALVYLIEVKHKENLKPIKAEKLVEEAIMHCRTFLNAELVSGPFYGKRFRFFSVTQTGRGNSIVNSFANIILSTTSGMVLVRLNIYNKYLVYFMPNPSSKIINEIFDEKIASQYDVEREVLNDYLGKEKENGEKAEISN